MDKEEEEEPQKRIRCDEDEEDEKERRIIANVFRERTSLPKTKRVLLLEKIKKRVRENQQTEAMEQKTEEDEMKKVERRKEEEPEEEDWLKPIDYVTNFRNSLTDLDRRNLIMETISRIPFEKAAFQIYGVETICDLMRTIITLIKNLEQWEIVTIDVHDPGDNPSTIELRLKMYTPIYLFVRMHFSHICPGFDCYVFGSDGWLACAEFNETEFLFLYHVGACLCELEELIDVLIGRKSATEYKQRYFYLNLGYSTDKWFF